MILHLEPGVHDLGRIDTEETVIVRGHDFTITNVEIHATTPGHDAAPWSRSVGPDWPRNRSHLRLEGVRNARIKRAAIHGPHAAGGVTEPAYVAQYEAQHAIALDRGCTDVTLEHVEAANVFGDFVYLRDVDGVRVRRFDFHANGRQGISFVSGRSVLVTDGRLEARRTAFDLEPNLAGDVVDGFTVRRVEVLGHRGNLLSSHGRGRVDHVTIEDVMDHDSLKVDVEAPAGVRRRSWAFRRLEGRRPHGTGLGYTMRFRGVDYLTLAELVQPLQSGRRMKLASTDGCRWVRAPAQYLSS